MTRKMKLAAGILATVVLTMSVPAMAEYYTTPDGAIVLTIPDKTWEEIADDQTVTTMSNGTGTITVLHYDADDKLPTVIVPGEKYEAAYQVVMADKEDVYVITGSVTDKEYMPEVRKIVQSATYYEENPYAGPVEETAGTAVAVPEQNVTVQTAAPTGNDVISPMDAIFYAVADGGLNIRAAYSSDAAIIGSYAYGEAINVIGTVIRDGLELGWYQVGFDGQTGYVSSAYVGVTQPDNVSQTVADSSNDYLTGEVVYIYNEDGSTTVIKQYKDGVWRDRMGYTYESTADGHWICQQ